MSAINATSATSAINTTRAATRAAFWLFVLLQCADVVTTLAFGGPAGEANPVILWLMAVLGGWWITVKLIASIGCGVYAASRHMLVLLFVIDFVMLFVVIGNALQAAGIT